MPADGMTVAVGACGNEDNGCNSGHARVCAFSTIHSSRRCEWKHLGCTLVGAASHDQFGHSVSMSADGVTVVVGAHGNNDSGTDSCHARVFTYSSTTCEWKRLGNAIVGAAPGDEFGCSVSMSADGMTVLCALMQCIHTLTQLHAFTLINRHD